MALSIDITSDVVCPWCFIGTERLYKVLAAMGLGESDVDLRYRAFFLDPDVPEGGVDLKEKLRSKYGVEPKQIFPRVEAEARTAGIALDLMKQATQYPTARAHTLLRHAYAKGTARALARALFQANFVDAKDIGSVDVLASLAAEHGFTVDEATALMRDEKELAATKAEAAAASAEGIRGVPFFVLGGKYALSGAQPEEAFREAIRRAQSA